MTETSPLPPLALQNRPPLPRDPALYDVAQRLEATFLAEMLKSAGFGEQKNSLSGGIGEDQFASFQRESVAEAMAARGGIGLAEQLYKAMLEAQNDK